jgi:hypothetical protein
MSEPQRSFQPPPNQKAKVKNPLSREVATRVPPGKKSGQKTSSHELVSQRTPQRTEDGKPDDHSL